MNVEGELQEKMVIYRTLESRMEILTKQRDLVANKITELLSTISSIDEIENGKDEILFKIGEEVYASGEIKSKDKVFVSVGANIVIEKSIIDGKKILNDRKEEMGNILKEIENNMNEISKTLKHLEPEINELIKVQNLAGK